MTTDHPAPGPPRRRAVFWTALLASLALLAGGTAVAVTAYLRTGGPAGAVRGYFQALQRGDAAAALGWGTVPAGNRALLRTDVLHEQQRIAPIVDLTVGRASGTGSRRAVPVSYSLRWPGGADSRVDTSVAVHEADGRWLLDTAAVSTTLTLTAAQQRASVLGDRLPDAAVLAFPGAPPVRFDTPYLALDPDIGIVPGATSSRTYAVTVSPAGQTAVQGAVVAAEQQCLAAAAPSVLCPLPDTGRYVPGSIQGTTSGDLRDVQVSVVPNQAGTIELTAQAPVAATAYRTLDFDNRSVTGHGPITVAVHALSAGRPPLAVTWVR